MKSTPIVFIVCIFIILQYGTFVRCQQIAPAEYNLLVSLRTLFHWETLYPDPIPPATQFNFCNTIVNTIQCFGDISTPRSVKALSLIGDGTQTIPDLSVFTQLKTLTIYNISNPNNFMSNLPSTVTILDCRYCQLTSIPTDIYDSFSSLNLYNNPLSMTFRLSYAPDLITLGLVNNEPQYINYYIDILNDSPGRLSIGSLSQMAQNSSLNFTNFRDNMNLFLYFSEQISVTELNFTQIFDAADIIDIKSVHILAPSLTTNYFDFPTDLHSSYEFEFVNIKFNTPSTFINLNQPQYQHLSALKIRNSPEFNINGSPVFSDIPRTNLISFWLSGVSLTTVGQLLVGLNTWDYSFSNNFLTKIPAMSNNEPQPKFVDLSYNLIDDVMSDAVFCNNFVDIKYNKFVGELNKCYSCYLNHPTIADMIKGNNFSNYQDGSTQYPPCEVTITNYNNVTAGLALILEGSLLPKYQYLVTSDPPFTWVSYKGQTKISATMGANSFVIAKARGYIVVSIHATQVFNFTIPINIIAPVIYNILISPLSNGYHFAIVGMSFNTDDANTTVTFNNYNCVVTPNNQSSSIECTLYILDLVEMTYRMNVTVGKLSTVLRYHFTRLYPVVSAITPCPRSGGSVSLFGEFGVALEHATIYIGGKLCSIQNIYPKNITCILGSGNGKQSVNVTVNGLNYYAENYFVYLEDSQQCPYSCGVNGFCNVLQYCTCKAGFGGPQCQYTVLPNGVIVNSTTTIISQEDINFHISLRSLQEMSYNNEVIREHMLGDWTQDPSPDNNTWIYSTQLKNTTISYTIFKAPNAMDFTFAGIPMHLEQDSIKISVNISKWEFQSSLNTLQLIIATKVNSESTCQSNIESYQDELEALNYFQIEQDGKVLYGKFIDQMLSDGKPTYSSTKILSKTEKEVIVGISIPQCRTECLIDPDFSLLVNPSSGCAENTSKKWIIPTAVVVSVVGFTSLAIMAVYMLRRGSYILISKNSLVIFNKTIKLGKLFPSKPSK
ncbi:tenascin C [Tieghemostelium lacteum]|uniref:Tenascin C n=1 Tax=Tieghemostelium lacteum TaxID=361077 RepID=A0A152A355_TIELA|nr:tenascin C [Tieghemostelium lacteum]|eukprot:KYR00639.1 tenascin C [Tieghemostelium lacteum]